MKSSGDRTETEAGELYRRELVKPGGQEQETAQQPAVDRHVHRREQCRALERPWASVAARLKPPHASRYPAVNNADGT